MLVPLVMKDDALLLIFTQRSTNVLNHKGEISFPGGAHESGDSTLLDTARRETREELGIDIKAEEVVGALDEVYTHVSNYVIIPYVAVLEHAPALKPSPREVDRIIEIPLWDLLDPRKVKAEEKWLEGRPWPLYFYTYGGYTIWGATARILTQLLELVARIA